MAGRFEGISDEMWVFLEPHVSKQHKTVGRPNANLRCVINSIFWVMITGARWCDLPEGKNFAKRSTVHGLLKKWQQNGLWQKIQYGLIELADLSKDIDWQKSSIDGSFSPFPRRRGRRF